MKRGDVERLLNAASGILQHREYVIIGSLSVLGASDSPPKTMVGSVDLDFYPRGDPDRAGEVEAMLGQESEFARKHGYYADPGSPLLATLPDGWEARLVPVVFESGVTALFLEANDAAISKYVRSEPRDKRWIRAGLKDGILSLAVIEYRLREETATERGEGEKARAAIAADREWLRKRLQRRGGQS